MFARLALRMLRWYRKYVRIWLPRTCRFEPSCSQYAVDAVERYGILKGTFFILRRLGRCHPFSRHSGWDPLQ